MESNWKLPKNISEAREVLKKIVENPDLRKEWELRGIDINSHIINLMQSDTTKFSASKYDLIEEIKEINKIARS
jgi:hypothetical protein